MQRTPIQSSAIAEIGYDAITRQLEVAFRNGETYRYDEVPPETVAALLESKSKGKYLNAEIRNHFHFDRIGSVRI